MHSLGKERKESDLTGRQHDKLYTALGMLNLICPQELLTEVSSSLLGISKRQEKSSQPDHTELGSHRYTHIFKSVCRVCTTCTDV